MTTAADSDQALVRVRGLSVRFAVRAGLLRPARGVVRAVDGVDLDIAAGETLGLVGESGCGKSTLGRAMLGLVRADAGQVALAGRPVLGADAVGLKALRRDMQLIFQDPYAALDPRQTVGAAVRAGLDIHGIGTPAERAERVAAIFAEVGLRPDHASRYPHEFSGGQRQRVVIARALVLNPKFVVCDEPVSALDVSVQAQILNLLQRLQRSHGLTYLFVSHNLGVIDYMADRVAVMYYGRIVEIAARAALFARPTHPYTRALMASIPVPDPSRRKTPPPMPGEPPDPMDLPRGCRFRSRCPLAVARCAEAEPDLMAVGAGHLSACWRNDAAPA
ncbi:MAG: ABC transporter ATP-binding protein [Alkalilacustris sp.]